MHRIMFSFLVCSTAVCQRFCRVAKANLNNQRSRVFSSSNLLALSVSFTTPPPNSISVYIALSPSPSIFPSLLLYLSPSPSFYPTGTRGVTQTVAVTILSERTMALARAWQEVRPVVSPASSVDAPLMAIAFEFKSVKSIDEASCMGSVRWRPSRLPLKGRHRKAIRPGPRRWPAIREGWQCSVNAGTPRHCGRC